LDGTETLVFDTPGEMMIGRSQFQTQDSSISRGAATIIFDGNKFMIQVTGINTIILERSIPKQETVELKDMDIIKKM